MKWYLSSLSFKKLIHQSKNLDKLGLYFQTVDDTWKYSAENLVKNGWKNWNEMVFVITFIQKTDSSIQNEQVFHQSKIDNSFWHLEIFLGQKWMEKLKWNGI